MAEDFSMEGFRAEVMKAANETGDAKVVSFCGNVLTKAAEFLSTHSLAADNIQGLETLWNGPIPQLNSDRGVVGSVSKTELLQMLEEVGVPKSMQLATAVECLRQLSGGVDQASVLEVPTVRQGVRNIGEIIGQRGLNTVSHDVRLATEAFGVDANNIAQDNRLSFVLTILKTNTSVLDRVLPRVSENSNYVVIKTDMGEVYDLTKSMDKSSATRNGATTRRPIADLFRTPDMVNSEPQAVIPDLDNDTDTIKKLVASVEPTITDPAAFVAGVTANLWDLVYDENRLGYSATDYSDLIAEGGLLKYALVKVVSGSASEIFAIPTKYLPTAKFAQQTNNLDSIEVLASVKTDYTLRAGRKLADGQTVSTLFADFTKSLVQITVDVTSKLNLSSGNISGTGTVEAKVIPAAGQTDVDATAAADFKNMTFTLVGYAPELFFDEENMRKTNIAVRVKTKQNEFTIPNGRNYVFDLALQQETDQSTLSMVSTVSSLGNSIRGLTIIESTLNEVADQLEFLQENPEMASLVDPRNMSIASSVVIPAVVRGTLNLNDGNTYVMRESERLTEGHARLRQTLLYALAQINAKSLYTNQLGAGETTVFKVVTHSLIKDLLIGIKDYHAVLDDKASKNGSGDISLYLPNGIRLDVVSTNFTNLEDTMLIFPIRESDPTSVTSFGTIRDRGNYTAQYNPINQQGVTRRVVQNTREIVMPTNPIGGILTIQGLKEFLSTIDSQFVPTTQG